MSMDLETALELVDAHRVELVRRYSPAPGDVANAHARTAEALRLVLDAARSASVVDRTNAAVARAREMLNPHAFAYGEVGMVAGQPADFCKCGALRSDPIHQKPETTP